MREMSNEWSREWSREESSVIREKSSEAYIKVKVRKA